MRLAHDRPYWWDGVVTAALPERPLPERVDVAIVGAGYTGLSAARTLARGGASVAVLEAQRVGHGASSRNGGQVLTGLKPGTETLLRRYGRERARRMHAASLAAIDFVESLVAEEGIDCGFARCGHLDAAFKPAHFEAFRREQELLEREMGHAVRLVPRSEQRAELGSDYYHGLMLDERSARLHPARYVHGLAHAALRAGAGIHEGTRVLRVERLAAGLRVHTSRGAVQARDVLFATNGYTDPAAPELRRRVVPLGSYIVATAPLPAALAAGILPRGRVVFDSKRFLFYFRLSDDGRLLFGGRARFTPASATSTRRAAEKLRRGMLDVFPALAGIPIEYAWSGNVCFAPDFLPKAGRLGGVHFALAYAGHGVGMASYLGDVMADVLLGRADRNPFADLPFAPIPLYDGRPWFLPMAGAFNKVLDWID